MMTPTETEAFLQMLEANKVALEMIATMKKDLRCVATTKIYPRQVLLRLENIQRKVLTALGHGSELPTAYPYEDDNNA